MKINRRDFIRLIGGVTGGLAFGIYGFSEVLDIPSKLVEQVKNGPGIIDWKSTVCNFCPGGCGLKIKTKDGLPIYAKGNSNYPINTGGVCPMAHGSLELLYHPERIKTPLKRKGIGGSGEFEPISWDEALKLIADKMNELRKSAHPERSAFIGYSESNLEQEFIKYFSQLFGSPNYYKYSFFTNPNIANKLQFGEAVNFSYSINNCNVVLMLGSNILETENAPVYYTKMFSNSKADESRRFKSIHVGSIMNSSAMYADRWISIKPGTYGALALGIAYVLIREEMIDNNFVNNNSFGFYDWKDKYGNERKGFQSYVFEKFYPEKVSEITGVPSSDIIYIARELGNNNPSVVIPGDEVWQTENGVFSMFAVNSLNALLGNFKNNDIIHLNPPEIFSPFEISKVDNIAKEGLRQKRIAEDRNGNFPFSEFAIESFAQNVLNSDPYPLELLFLYRGNLLFQTLNKHKLTEALKKIPLIVSFDSFVNETNIYADLILPINTFMEEWNIITSIPGVSFQNAGIRQPIVEKFYDTKQVPDILIELSQKLSGNISTEIKYKSYFNLIKEKVNELYQSGKGAITSEKMSGLWLEYLNKRGWHVGRYQSFDDFWDLLLKHGGWWNPDANSIKNKQTFSTKSGKYEFYSLLLEELIGKPETHQSKMVKDKLNEWNIAVRGDEVFLPHFKQHEEEKEYPFHLLMYRVGTNKDGSASNIPLMQELFGLNVRYYWNTWAEINSKTADKLDVSENDFIRVTSDVGNLKLKVKISDGILENAVAIPFGMGHSSYGKYADGFGYNPTSIIRNKYDRLSGIPAYLSTKVKISKISRGV